MKTLDRYIIKELFPPFFGGFAVIMFVLVLDFILDILNLIIAKGVPVFVVLKLFIYSLAWMLSLAVPMSCLVASLMAFGRLSSDNEIIAARAVGIPFWRMMLPAAFVMALLSVIMVIFGDRIVPETNLRAKTIMVQIRRKKPLTALKPRAFINDFPNIVLYIEKIDDKQDKLYGVTIYEKRQGREPRIITAPVGEVKYDKQGDAITFTLYNGEIHDTDPDDPSQYTRAQFSRQVITIGDLGTKLGEEKLKRRGDRELTIGMLRQRIEKYKSESDSLKRAIREIVSGAIDSVLSGYQHNITSVSPERRALLRQRKVLALLRKYSANLSNSLRRWRRLEVELHKKYSLPLACLIFFLVGAPVGAWVRKGGIGVAAGLSFGFFLIYWAFLIGGEEIADRNIISPAVGMWSGNIVMLIISAAMLYRVTYQSRFTGFGWMANLLRRRKTEEQINAKTH